LPSHNDKALPLHTKSLLILQKADNSKHCKIYCGTSHVTENCWQKTGKPVFAGNQQNQQKQRGGEQQQSSGNQSSGRQNQQKKKDKGKGKGKGKANETHIADTAMIVDGRYISDDSDRTITFPRITVTHLDQPGASTSSQPIPTNLDDEILDWGDNNEMLDITPRGLLQTHINFPRFLPIFPDFLEQLSHLAPIY
jgi:hypothetical protein